MKDFFREIKIPNGILIDLDGVLIDTEHLNGEAWRKTALYFGTNLSKIQLQQLLGRPRIDCANEVLSYISKGVNLKELLNIHRPYQKELLKDSKAIAGAKDFISFLNESSIASALVTSSGSASVSFKISLQCTRERRTVKGKPPTTTYIYIHTHIILYIYI